MCLIISHRGYRENSTAVENTSNAMIRSIGLGARAIEFDVHLTSCGTLVLFHNDTFECNGTMKYISETSYAEIRASIPSLETLDEFLTNIYESVDQSIVSRLTLVVDVKTILFFDGVGLLGNTLLEHLSTYRIFGFNFVITSFNHSFIESYLHSDECSFPTGVLIYHVPSKYAIERPDFPEWVGIDHSQISGGLVEMFHSCGKKIYAYTPNTEMEIRKCVDAGVDGIYTDALELAQRIVL